MPTRELLQLVLVLSTAISSVSPARLQAGGQHTKAAATASPTDANLPTGNFSTSWLEEQLLPGQLPSQHKEFIEHVGRMLLQSANSSLDGNSSAATMANSTSIELVLLDDACNETDSSTMTDCNYTANSAMVAANTTHRKVAARVMFLLSDAAWLVYAAGHLYSATCALFQPLVAIGQTGQVTINALYLLNFAQLLANFVARFGDVFSKVFWITARAVKPI